jgi:hypothetical protein
MIGPIDRCDPLLVVVAQNIFDCVSVTDDGLERFKHFIIVAH